MVMNIVQNQKFLSDDKQRNSFMRKRAELFIILSVTTLRKTVFKIKKSQRQKL